MAAPKHQLLFVDDEPNVLHGIRRMLRSRRDVWEMTFVSSGNAALAFLEDNSVDVVVSDMKMPEMDGAALLCEVQRLYPETIRVVLSGFSELEAVLKTVGPSHQYLAKPCEPDALMAAVDRALALKADMDSEVVRNLVTGLKSIPAMPGTLRDLLDEISSPSASVRSVAQIVANDVGLTAQLLKLVNSAYFGLPRQVADPKAAVNLLGLETVKALACVEKLFEGVKGDEGMLSDVTRINRRSMKIGALAKAIASSGGFDEATAAQACCAGVLSHIGILPVLAEWPEQWTEAVNAVERDDGKMTDAERRVFGTNHAEVGAYLLGLWGFNTEIVDAVKFHHDPAECSDRGPSALTAVHIAQYLVRKDQDAYCDGSGLDDDYLQELGLADRLPQWEETYRQLADAEASI